MTLEPGMRIRDAEAALIRLTLQIERDTRKAAKLLGISQRTLYNKLHAYRMVDLFQPYGDRRRQQRREM